MLKKSYIIVLALFFFVSSHSFAQYKEWGTKLGFRYNQLFPENEFKNIGFGGNDDFSFDSYKFSYLIEGFLAFELTKVLELQVTAGYGTYAGYAMFKTEDSFGEYEATIIPVNLRFRVSPWDVSGWNPYFYFGGGLMNYDLKTQPTDDLGGLAVKTERWVGIIPAGIGAEFAVTPTLLLDFAIGGGLTTTYDLDGYRSGSDEIWDSYFNVSAGLTFTGESGSSDRDNDGLTKREEEALGTNPNNPDTDGEGLKDGEEVNKYKTNPLMADSDLDGLSDYNEIFKYKTDPNNPDTDGDGLTDSEEVMKYKTDPLNKDTDGDGLTDFEEVSKYLTDPLKADTDGDGLSDTDEVMKYKTDPLVKDTDGGTVDDGVEVKRGTDPLNAEDDVVKVGVPIILEGITFATGKSIITPESEYVLRKALKTLTTYSEIVVEISGHTDITGSRKTNERLSQQRADAVRDWLVGQGVAPDRIFTKGYGPDKPIASNDTPEGKQKNRRIEFTRIK